MPKDKTAKPRYLPPWANEPLKFTFSPDDALRQGSSAKVPGDRKQPKPVKRR